MNEKQVKELRWKVAQLSLPVVEKELGSVPTAIADCGSLKGRLHRRGIVHNITPVEVAGCRWDCGQTGNATGVIFGIPGYPSDSLRQPLG